MKFNKFVSVLLIAAVLLAFATPANASGGTLPSSLKMTISTQTNGARLVTIEVPADYTGTRSMMTIVSYSWADNCVSYSNVCTAPAATPNVREVNFWIDGGHYLMKAAFKLDKKSMNIPDGVYYIPKK